MASSDLEMRPHSGAAPCGCCDAETEEFKWKREPLVDNSLVPMCYVEHKGQEFFILNPLLR